MSSAYEAIDNSNILWEWDNGQVIGVKTKAGSVGFGGSSGNVPLSASNSPAFNFTLLQTALTNAGIVKVPGDLGLVPINFGFTIPADTTLEIGPGTTLQQPANGNNYFATNANSFSGLCTFQGSTSGTTLTVSQVFYGSISPGQIFNGTDGTNKTVAAGIVVSSQLTGATGGVGTYQLASAPAANIASNSAMRTQNNYAVTSITYNLSTKTATIQFPSTPWVTAGGYLEIVGDSTNVYNGIWKINAVNTVANTATFTLPANSNAWLSTSGSFVSSGSGTGYTIPTTDTSAVVVGGLVTGAGVPANTYVQSIRNNTSVTLTASVTYTASTYTTVTTPLVKPADANITIIVDGYIDYNSLNNTPTNSPQACQFWFNRIGALKVPRINHYGAKKFSFMLANAFDCEFGDIHAISASDGLHCYGHVYNVSVSNMKGSYGDDIIALGALYSDQSSRLIPPDAYGPIDGVTVNSVQARTGTAKIIAIYGSDYFGAKVNNVVGNNLNCTGATACSAEAAAGDTTSSNNIKLTNISSRLSKFFVSTSANINDLTITNIHDRDYSGYLYDYPLNISASTITNLTINDSTINLDTTAGAFYVVNMQSASTITNLNINNCFLNGNPIGSSIAGYFRPPSGCTITNVTINGGSVTGVAAICEYTAGSTVSNLYIGGGHIYNGSFGIHAPNTKITINGVVNKSGSGLFHIYDTSLTWNLQVNSLVNTGVIFGGGYGTTNTINILQGDGSLVADAGLVVGSAGAKLTHSSAVAGRNAANQQGFAVYNGANWYAVATGAAGVNTLIV